MANAQAFIEFGQLSICELSSVVRDDGMWDSKPANDVFPYKTLDLSSRDTCEGFCFYPHCKIIDYYQQELPLSSC